MKGFLMQYHQYSFRVLLNPSPANVWMNTFFKFVVIRKSKKNMYELKTKCYPKKKHKFYDKLKRQLLNFKISLKFLLCFTDIND